MAQPSLIARHDTFLGVCEGLGQDLGVNPLWLRLAFGALLLVSPAAVLATYLGLGVLVAASRRLFPAGAAEAEPIKAAPLAAENDETPIALAA